MYYTKYTIKTRDLNCDILESIIIICARGASLCEIHRYLNKKISKPSLKFYLYYLIDHGSISYGKSNQKYYTEYDGFELIYDIYNECMVKNTNIENMLISFEMEISDNLIKFR